MAEKKKVRALGAPRILNPGASRRGWHRLQLAAECLQKYAWTYLSPEPDKFDITRPALAKGSLIHLALAQHYRRMQAQQEGTNEAEWCEVEEAVRFVAQKDKISKFADVALDAYHSYCIQYPPEIEEQQRRIIAVESLLETKIAGEYLLTGRIDLAYEDLSGFVHVTDHKTTSRLTNQQAKYYAVSGQLFGYSHMAREKYGERYQGLEVNLIQHTNPKFSRVSLPRSPHLESNFERILVDIEKSIDRIYAEKRDYWDWPKAINEMTCYGRYGACPFLDLCRQGPGAKAAGSWEVDASSF